MSVIADSSVVGNAGAVTARVIALLGFPGVQGLDLTGPMDVFAGARELVERTGRDDPGYRIVAGMDLALALVEQDLGRPAALTVARWLVMFLHRPGNQAQFSVQLTGQLSDRDPIRDVQRWLSDHLAANLSVPALAARARMSPRHFARTFHQQTGVTSGHFVQQARMEAARRRLEESSTPVDQIAADCGFGSAETMRRTFVQVLGVAPAEYRRRFQVAPGRFDTAGGTG